MTPNDSGALESANLLKNNIGKEQIESLIKIKKEKGMISLCGLKEGQTEANFSDQGLGPEDAMLISLDIQDMGALAVLNLANNNLTRGNAKYSNSDPKDPSHWETDMAGITALAKALER